MDHTHHVGPAMTPCPSGRMGPQYSLLIIKGDKKGLGSEKLYFEQSSVEFDRNNHIKQNMDISYTPMYDCYQFLQYKNE